MMDYISPDERVKEEVEKANIMLDNIVWFFALLVIMFSFLIIVTN